MVVVASGFRGLKWIGFIGWIKLVRAFKVGFLIEVVSAI